MSRKAWLQRAQVFTEDVRTAGALIWLLGKVFLALGAGKGVPGRGVVLPLLHDQMARCCGLPLLSPLSHTYLLSATQGLCVCGSFWLERPPQPSDPQGSCL